MWKPKCCIGSQIPEDGLIFDKLIGIYTVSVELQNTIDGVPEKVYALVLSAEANIKTKTTRNFDNGVNLGDTITTVFTIRWRATFDDTKSYYIKFKNKNFKVRNIENINEEDKYIKFTTVERGEDDIEANKF